MGVIRATLYDFDTKTNEPKEPMTVELAYDDSLSLEEQGFKKIAIFAGDDVGGGNVLIPLAMLNECMTTLMLMDAKREVEAAPKIIMPNTGLVGFDKK